MVMVTTLPERFAPVPATITGCGAKLKKLQVPGTGGHKASCKTGASAARRVSSRHVGRRGGSSAAACGIWSSLLISKFCWRNLSHGDARGRYVESLIGHVGNRQRLACRELELLGRRDCHSAVQTLSASRGGYCKRRLWKRRD